MAVVGGFWWSSLSRKGDRYTLNRNLCGPTAGLGVFVKCSDIINTEKNIKWKICWKIVTTKLERKNKEYYITEHMPCCEDTLHDILRYTCLVVRTHCTIYYGTHALLWGHIARYITEHMPCCEDTLHDILRNTCLFVRTHCTIYYGTHALLWGHIARYITEHMPCCEDTLHDILVSSPTKLYVSWNFIERCFRLQFYQIIADGVLRLKPLGIFSLSLSVYNVYTVIVTLLTNFLANEDFFRCFSDSANECFSGCVR